MNGVARKWHCYRKRVSGRSENAELNAHTHTLFSFALSLPLPLRLTPSTSFFALPFAFRFDNDGCIRRGRRRTKNTFWLLAHLYMHVCPAWVCLLLLLLLSCTMWDTENSPSVAVLRLQFSVSHESFHAREMWSPCSFLMFAQMRTAHRLTDGVRLAIHDGGGSDASSNNERAHFEILRGRWRRRFG